MHIYQLYLVGMAAWLFSLALTGSCWQFFNPFALPALAVLHILQDRAPQMARDDRDARQTAYLLFVLTSIVFVLATRSWTLGPSLIVVGYACHHIVLLSNGLATPAVGYNGSPVYSEVGPATRVRWLCDIFPSRHGRSWFSLGDVFVITGIWMFAAELWLARFTS